MDMDLRDAIIEAINASREAGYATGKYIHSHEGGSADRMRHMIERQQIADAATVRVFREYAYQH